MSKVDAAVIAANVSLELLARGIYLEEAFDQSWPDGERPPRWIELTQEDRDEYRKVATKLVATEYVP